MTAHCATYPIAIIGGGFSGTMLAVNLARLDQKVVLIEKSRDQLGKGLAYGTSKLEHCLNVRASNMSALASDKGHFCQWLGQDYDGDSFVSRQIYGDYLRHELHQTRQDLPCLIDLEIQAAVDLVWHHDLAHISLSDGRTLNAKCVVLAQGNQLPHMPSYFANLPPGLVANNPWDAGSLDVPLGTKQVLLIGTGLTAIDVILSLKRAGFGGHIIALSRRGLVPRAHCGQSPSPQPQPRPVQTGRDLVRYVRQRGLDIGWRTAIDELRPHIAEIWRAHDTRGQAQLLRHLRPYWDVHRHRLSPQIAQEIEHYQSTGEVRFLAGQVTRTQLAQDMTLCVEYSARLTKAACSLTVGKIFNCTGPQSAPSASNCSLMKSLVEQKAVRSDVHNLGLDVDENCRIRREDGTSHLSFYAIGPLTKGAFWEVTAVPEIRQQVATLASRLAKMAAPSP